jgi:hypothetical protein
VPRLRERRTQALAQIGVVQVSVGSLALSWLPAATTHRLR